MGKGSRRRPARITQAEFDRRWKLAFGKHDKTRTPARSGNVRGVNKVRSRAVGSRMAHNHEVVGSSPTSASAKGDVMPLDGDIRTREGQKEQYVECECCGRGDWVAYVEPPPPHPDDCKCPSCNLRAVAKKIYGGGTERLLAEMTSQSLLLDILEGRTK